MTEFLKLVIAFCVILIILAAASVLTGPLMETKPQLQPWECLGGHEAPCNYRDIRDTV